MAVGKLNVKKGDQVIVLAGKDKGKKGKVLAAFPQKNSVKIEGVNIIKKHAKPTPKVPQGGIREIEAPIGVSRVMVVCPSCGKPTRVARKVSGSERIRACKKCGESLDK